MASPMPTPSQSKTVLFSDIVGSSKLYQKLGNARAENTIRFVMKTLAACTEKYSGTVIKTIGDEIMCSFDSLHDASECAIEMNNLTQESHVELRTGISSGALIARDNDLFGDVVNNAAFLTKTARAREILIDEMALDCGDVSSSRKIELVAEMTIKGQSEPCKIYRLNWEHALNASMAATMVGNTPSQDVTASKRMIIHFDQQAFSVDTRSPILVVGRDKANVAIKINHVKISRKHCTIELKQGKFILQDHSTNGTYVFQDKGETTSVHRESFALLGKGLIRLGQMNADEQCSMNYEII